MLVVATKSELVRVRLTGAERERLEGLARQRNLSLSEYVRSVLFGALDWMDGTARIVANAQPRDVPARQVAVDPKPLVPSLRQQPSGKRSFSPDPKIKK